MVLGRRRPAGPQGGRPPARWPRSPPPPRRMTAMASTGPTGSRDGTNGDREEDQPGPVVEQALPVDQRGDRPRHRESLERGRPRLRDRWRRSSPRRGTRDPPRRPVARFRTTATTAAESSDAGHGQEQQRRGPAAQLAEPKAIGGLEHEAREQDQQHELRRHLEPALRPSGPASAPMTRPTATRSDRGRQAKRAGDDGHDARDPEQDDEELDQEQRVGTGHDAMVAPPWRAQQDEPAAPRGARGGRRRSAAAEQPPPIAFVSASAERRRPVRRRIASISSRYGRPIGIRSSHSRYSRSARAISPERPAGIAAEVQDAARGIARRRPGGAGPVRRAHRRVVAAAHGRAPARPVARHRLGLGEARAPRRTG